MDHGTEAITEAETLAAVRRQARRIQVQSITAAAVLTAVFVIITGD